MMNIKPLASNMTELNLDGVSVLFSYETPVAGWDSKGAFRTEDWFSTTTTRHINKYLGGKAVGRTVPQSHIDELVGEKAFRRHWDFLAESYLQDELIKR